MTLFLQYINQPNRRDLTALVPSNLYRVFVGTPGNPGKWNLSIGKSTFYDFINSGIVKVIQPHLVPYVTETHIIARAAWANEFLSRPLHDQILFVLTAIFIDGTIFADKFEAGYGVDKLRVVVDSDSPLDCFFAQFPVLARNQQLYQGLNYFATSKPFIVNEHREDKKGSPNKEIIASFLRTHIAPLAQKIRRSLSLPPDYELPIVWDHARVHKNWLVREVLEELHLYDADLPARCPELNVIEMLWALYKNDLGLHPRAESLKADVIEATRRLEAPARKNLCLAFIAIAEEMRARGGHAFKYKGNDERTDEIRALA